MKRILTGVLAVLLTTSAANAAIISAPTGSGFYWSSDWTELLVPISVSGGDLIKAATINIAITAGRITALERRVGIFANGTNVVDPPSIYIDSQGRSAVFSDYSLGFTQPPVAASGTLAILHIDLTGVWTSWIDILLSDTDAGDTAISDASGNVVPAHLVNGWYAEPEPTSLSLLALGALLIRRRP